MLHDDTQGNKLVKIGGYPIGNIKGLWGKTRYLRDQMTKLCDGHKIDLISIEEPLMMFHKSGSSASVIQILNRFNGMVSFMVRDLFDAPVVFVNSSAARKKVGIKLNKQLDTKEQIFAWVKSQDLMKNYAWPTKILKSGPRKGQEVFEAICYDISDSYVTALWACQSLNTLEIDETIC